MEVPLSILLKSLSFLSPNDDCEIGEEIELKDGKCFVMFSEVGRIFFTGLAYETCHSWDCGAH